MNKEVNNNTGNMSNEIYKPLSVATNDLMQELIKTANSSGLPLVVIEYVVRDFYEEVKNTAVMQHEKDKEEYENAISQRIAVSQKQKKEDK